MDSNPLGYYDPDGLTKYNAIQPGQTSYKSGENVPDTPGSLTIISHGNSQTMNHMTAEQWADFIRNDLTKKGLWEPKMPIILHACKTGDAEATNEPLAAKLARLLGVPVTAPSASLWDYPWPFNNYERPTPYKDMTGGNFPGDPGYWNRFDPNGKATNIGPTLPKVGK